MSELTEIDDGGGGEVLLPTVPLSPRELAWCESFGNPESETFGNATASAAAAGYVQPRSAAFKLRRRSRIIAKLAEYHKAVTVAVGRVLTDLEHERQLALAKGDVSSAIRASELMGKSLGMFVDVVAADPGPAQRYDARLAQEQSRVTTVLLMMDPQAPIALPEAAQVGQEPQAPRTARQESES
jgi:hypothetical protein